MVEVVPVPAFSDNYIWVIRDAQHAAVVDPGDAEPVLAYLSSEGLTLTAIINTHHHGDHVGGNAALLKRFPVPVFGPRQESIPGMTRALDEGDRISVPGLELELEVLDVPGHTAGHIAYYGQGLLFCGDTLFACGCGRLFEGTPRQMTGSLGKLARLPGDTKVYCAHEYTLSNIRFARAADPDNAALAQRELDANKLRERGVPTVPSTIELERATNPFLRYTEPGVVAAVERHEGRALSDPVQVFAALRQWKNRF